MILQLFVTVRLTFFKTAFLDERYAQDTTFAFSLFERWLFVFFLHMTFNGFVVLDFFLFVFGRYYFRFFFFFLFLFLCCFFIIFVTILAFMMIIDPSKMARSPIIDRSSISPIPIAKPYR